MMAKRPKRVKMKPKDEAVQFLALGKDKDGFDVKFINSFKGRGVFSTCHFEKGSFLVEYRGEVINKLEYEDRLRIYHDAMKVFMFEFRHNGKLMCVDASREDDSLGRLVNDDHVSPNSKMKTITVNGQPHLCLFAIKDIKPGEEITYDYGNSDWPWRLKVTSLTDAAKADEPLASKQDIQVTSLYDAANADEPLATLSSKQDTQVTSLYDAANADEPLATLSSKQDTQVTSLYDAANADEPLATLSSKQDTQVTSLYDAANADEPLATLSSKQDTQVTSLYDAANADEPLATLSSKQDTQVTSLYDAANADEPLATLSSKQDTQVTSLYDAANADEPLATLSSKQDTQVTSLYDAANADEPLATLSSKQDTQVTSLYDAANADEPLATLSSKQDTQVTSLYDATNADEPLATLSSKQDTQVTSLTDAAKADEPLASKQDIQVLSHTDVAEAVTVASPLSTQDIQSCKHVLCPSSMTSMEKCVHCLGPYSARKWDGVKCRVCSSIWHEKCFNNTMRDSSLVSEESDPSDEVSEEEYVPDSVSSSSDSDKLSDKKLPQREQFEVQEEEMSLKTTARTEDAENIQSSSVSSTEKKNYCFVCDKPQSKLARHFQVHEKTHAEVAEVLALPINSKMRKLKLDRLRNKGNCKHNSEVYKSGSGLLKIKRKPKKIYDLNQYVHCTYCQGLYLRKHFWRHAHKCKAKPLQDEQESGRVLTLASMVDSSLCQQISQSVWKLLSVMRDDEVATAVRSDFNILQLAQSFFNKHGQDPTKHEYIRQKIREVGRLLLILRKDYSVYNLEEAVRPSNFHTLVQAVKKVSGFDEEKHSFQTPSLALKLGHSLHKICDIINCKALMTGDCELKKSTQAFKKLYSTKWSELVSHTALTTLDDKHFNKPSTLPFTEDVKRLHQHLEKVGNSASETLKCDPSPQAYGELCKTTLSKIILFNRRRGGEVSKMHLSAFAMRDTSPLHKDVALGLSQFEQKLCAHFSRVEIKGKRGRKVAVLLSPDMVEAINILISRRQECGVPQKNPFLFARPHCLTPFRAQDCLRLYSNQCGAQRPDLLRSTQLRKHVATLSQVLNLKNHELDQVADFLGHDIRVHREYYRLPEATTQLAKISKLLIALDKGALSDLQGKTLEEIEIEDELDLTDSDGGEESETEELTECSTNEEPSEPPGTRDESKRAREPVDDISVLPATPGS
ncbi:uncharacterized protein [Nothobranchius furzeri]|uniref:uncharacterized protein isoform X6 n=1 Tax=Nothobranchius furzeri TaxID=105023 RepID=UPI00390498C8